MGKVAKLIVAAVIAAPLLGGCVSMGPNYDIAAVDRLQVGMSKQQVIAMLGRPTTTTRLADGREQLMWVHSRGTMLGRAEARAVILMFDAGATYTGMVSQSETDVR